MFIRNTVCYVHKRYRSLKTFYISEGKRMAKKEKEKVFTEMQFNDAAVRSGCFGEQSVQTGKV